MTRSWITASRLLIVLIPPLSLGGSMPLTRPMMTMPEQIILSDDRPGQDNPDSRRQGTCARSDWRIFEPLRGEFEWVRWEQPMERACDRLQRAAQYRFPALLGDKRRPCHQSWVRRHHFLQNGLLLSQSTSTRVSPISRSIHSSNRASSSRPFLRRRHSRNVACTSLRKPRSRCADACHCVSSGIRSGQPSGATNSGRSIKGLRYPIFFEDHKHISLLP